MAAEAKRGDALQLIFSFFLGLLLVVLIGAGVWTFYPQPYSQNTPEGQKLQDLYRQRESIDMKTGPVARTPAQQAEWDRLDKQIRAIEKKRDALQSTWAINTSIVLITFATALMAISLFLPEHLRVFSNGVLLGGLFTVLYGTAWSFAGGNSRARFFVILVAVVLAIAFGYLRFVRGRKQAEAAARASAAAGVVPVAVSDEGAAALLARVEALEARAAAAAEALGGERR